MCLLARRTNTLYQHTVRARSMMACMSQTDRRSAILDAAERLVREHGLSGASVRAVAADAGIGASTLR
ncbi:TetR/AcrR family transcriptional regulator, partial [Agrococcus casei]|uniref:TetR/AcrR family transcriptional regulator n=1 Tax=Agrococcus casei TaxID=343512 RepID=UPI003F9346AD